MEKFYVNSVIKSTLNKKLMYHVVSIEPKRKVNCSDTDDYIIEYNILYKNVNGEKVKDGFTHKSLLSEFGNNERKLLAAMIKLRCIIKEHEKKVILEPEMV